MKKLPTIVLALLLAPLVGTVALSDFNYIGQGGGGLSESDVQTLIDASVAAAAYAPAEDPNSNAFGGGGLVIGTNIVQMSFQTDPFGFSVAPQFVMQIPTPQTTPSIYFLCRGTVATVNAASGPLLFGGCTAGWR